MLIHIHLFLQSSFKRTTDITRLKGRVTATIAAVMPMKKGKAKAISMANSGFSNDSAIT